MHLQPCLFARSGTRSSGERGNGGGGGGWLVARTRVVLRRHCINRPSPAPGKGGGALHRPAGGGKGGGGLPSSPSRDAALASGGVEGSGGAALHSSRPSLDAVLGASGMEVEQTVRGAVGAAAMEAAAVSLDGAARLALTKREAAAWVGLMGVTLQRQVELYKIQSRTAKSDSEWAAHARKQVGPLIKGLAEKPHAERMAALQEEADGLQSQIDLARQSRKRRLSMSAPEGPASEGP